MATIQRATVITRDRPPSVMSLMDNRGLASRFVVIASISEDFSI
jgi:hypothetical protein